MLPLQTILQRRLLGCHKGFFYPRNKKEWRSWSPRIFRDENSTVVILVSWIKPRRCGGIRIFWIWTSLEYNISILKSFLQWNKLLPPWKEILGVINFWENLKNFISIVTIPIPIPLWVESNMRFPQWIIIINYTGIWTFQKSQNELNSDYFGFTNFR